MAGQPQWWSFSGRKKQFLDSLAPAAMEHGARIGVDPRIILAQAAQETGWGRAAPGNNYFGIKSHGQGGGQSFATHEVINGNRVAMNDSFRQFASPADSVAGYADFLSKNKRYQPMLQAQGMDAQISALGRSGYATDPNYGASISQIANSLPATYAPESGPSATPAGKAVTALAVGDTAQSPFGSPPPAPAMQQGHPEQQFPAAPPPPDRKIFGLSTTPPEPGSRAMAIAKAIGAYGAGLAAGNPAAGLQGAAQVASDFTQGRANIQQAQGMGLTPQQMGVLGALPPEQQSAILAQQAFQKPAGPTDLQRNLEMLPEADRQKALRMQYGLEPKATDLAASAPASYQEFRLAQQDPVAPFKGSYTEWKNSGGGGGDEAGLQATYWKDSQGNLHAGQLLKGGGVKEIPLPEGGSWSPGVGYLDTGTGFVPYDKRGGVDPNAQPIVKNNTQEAFDKGKGGAEGKAQGEAGAAYDSIKSKLPGLQTVVADLDKVSEKATYTFAGKTLDDARRQLGLDPSDGALARAEYIAKVDNQILPLLRDTFGAAFTVKEGETLRATLGDPNKSPKEKQIVLKAFVEQKIRDVEALGAQSGKVSGTPGKVPEGVDPADWEYMSPEDRALFK
jgi:Mannosyl-glycoprotein endo-beta-N-acetylglucosaminidase